MWQLPNPHRPVRVATGEIVTVRAYGDTCHRHCMSTKRAKVFSRTQVPDLDRSVFARAYREATVVGKRHASHRLAVPVELLDYATAGEIPDRKSTRLNSSHLGI